MKKIFFCLLLILLPFFAFSASNYELIGRPHFVPENFYVGDTVNCVIKVKVEDETVVEWDRSEPLLDRLDLKILSIESHARGINQYEIDIQFISFYPQNRIPELRVGEIVLPEIPINTFSFLESEQVEFESLKPQVLLPYTIEIIAAFCFLLLFIIIFFLFLSKRFRKMVFQLFRHKTKFRPAKKINQTIRMLSTQSRDFSPIEFYTKLTFALRDFLEEVMEQNLSFVTTGEMKERVQQFFVDKRIPPIIVDLLVLGDEVKFGKKIILRSQMKHDLVVLKRVVTLIEKEITARNGSHKTEEVTNEFSL